MNNQAQTPVGAWLVAVAMPGQDHFPGLLTFNSDGTLMASESPSPFESTGHGSWQMADSGTVAYTFVALFGNAEGKNTGRLKMVGRLHNADGQDDWSGPFKLESTDSLGKITFTACGTFALTRIAVESLA